MSEQQILHIRKSISLARRLEEKNQALRSLVSARLPSLHHLISLPERDAEDSLVKFVTNYIEHVPDFIEALHELTRLAGIEEQASVFLDIAEDYFLHPPELVSDRSGMHLLIDEAYLAHRLIEEINDRVMMVYGIPLAPMDMTMSNIIIHEILGEEFANQLDLAVHYSIESFFRAEDLSGNQQFANYIEHRKRQGWQDALDKWPFLAGDNAVSLELSSSVPANIRH